jgi:hypothetical protein
MAKVFKIIGIFCILVFLATARQSLAGMQSSDYNIWLDTFTSVGGSLSSDNYQIDGSISDRPDTGSSSDRFTEKTIFSGIDEEPSVGFNVQTVTLQFGELSPNQTAYSSHTFSAFTNAKDGYTIKVYGQPLHSNDYTIPAIGATADQSHSGTEQFGLNLVANTTPVVGANPANGNGLAAANYDTANNFAFEEGGVIAYAESYSYQTDFTVSVIVNIAEDTPAGSYGSVLTYEFIPVF